MILLYLFCIKGEYYMVGMRTNMEGTAVVGLLGEQGGEALGMIWYPFQWWAQRCLLFFIVHVDLQDLTNDAPDFIYSPL